MKPLFNIIWKNFKLLFRSKTSALIIFLGPLLIVTLIGAAFSNTGAYSVNIGVYSQSYSKLSNDLLTKFSENQYKVTKLNTKENCINSIKTGENNLCMIFPENFNFKNKAPIDFHIDYSEINLVYAVLDVMETKIGEKSSEITQNLASELLQKISDAKTNADQGITNINSIKSKNTEASSKITTIQNELIALEVYDLSKISTSDVSSKIDDIKDSLNDLNELLEDIEDEVDDVADSSAKENALDLIDDAFDELNSSISIIENSDNTTVDLETSLQVLKISLQNASKSLNSLENAKANSAKDLDTAKSRISESITSLNSLSLKNNELKTNLGALTVQNAEKISQPLKTNIFSVVKESTHFNFIFSTLVILIIMITSILLASTLIMSEKKSRAFFRNFITPTNDIVFNTGMFLSAFIIILVQVILFLIVSQIFFKTDLLASVFSSSIMLIIVITFFVSFGMLIGYLFKSNETNTLASISISSLFLFLSSAVLPLESMPEKFRMIAGFNPFVIGETALRKIIFFNFNLLQVKQEVVLLIAYTIVTAILTYLLQKFWKHKILFHFHKPHLHIKRKNKSKIDKQKHLSSFKKKKK